jgi:hypothetical protein
VKVVLVLNVIIIILVLGAIALNFVSFGGEPTATAGEGHGQADHVWK